MDPESSPMQYKPCCECWARLPLAAYGLYRRARDGRSGTCKECKQEYASFRYTARFGRRHRLYNPEIIRGAMRHNTLLVNQMFVIMNLSLVGYIPHTDQVFKVLFGKDQRGIQSFAIINVDGSSFQDFTYSHNDVELMKAHILNLLKENRIRLELTDADMIASKTVIYYL